MHLPLILLIMCVTGLSASSSNVSPNLLDTLLDANLSPSESEVVMWSLNSYAFVFGVLSDSVILTGVSLLVFLVLFRVGRSVRKRNQPD